jgi:lysophospholipase L1-like esterase
LALARAAKDAAPVVAIATFAVQYRRGQSPEQQVQAATTSLYYMPYMSIEGLLQSFAAYNSVIRDVAKQEEIVLIGNEDHIPGNPAHFTDSVHFTDAGSLKMAERVTEALLASRELALLVEKVED